MNNDKKARRRHQRICEVLQEQEHMQVLELCELFHVSPATIRNDLTVLEKKQLLKRIPDGFAGSVHQLDEASATAVAEALKNADFTVMSMETKPYRRLARLGVLQRGHASVLR